MLCRGMLVYFVDRGEVSLSPSLWPIYGIRGDRVSYEEFVERIDTRDIPAVIEASQRSQRDCVPMRAVYRVKDRRGTEYRITSTGSWIAGIQSGTSSYIGTITAVPSSAASVSPYLVASQLAREARNAVDDVDNPFLCYLLEQAVDLCQTQTEAIVGHALPQPGDTAH